MQSFSGSSEEEIWHCKRICSEAIESTYYPESGPVHINIPLREPLYNTKDYSNEKLPDHFSTITTLLELPDFEIQELQKTTGCTIVINEDPVTEEGIVEILGTDQDGIDSVLAKIDSLLFKPVKGNTYKVKVIKMLDFVKFKVIVVVQLDLFQF